MLQRYKLVIEYDGKPFTGWAPTGEVGAHPMNRSVCETIEV
jgi:hypothetical protein